MIHFGNSIKSYGINFGTSNNIIDSNLDPILPGCLDIRDSGGASIGSKCLAKAAVPLEVLWSVVL